MYKLPTSWRTFLSGFVSAVAKVAGEAFPEHKGLADAIGSLALVALGYFAADQSVVKDATGTK